MCNHTIDANHIKFGPQCIAEPVFPEVHDQADTGSRAVVHSHELRDLSQKLISSSTGASNSLLTSSGGSDGAGSLVVLGAAVMIPDWLKARVSAERLKEIESMPETDRLITLELHRHIEGFENYPRSDQGRLFTQVKKGFNLFATDLNRDIRGILREERVAERAGRKGLVQTILEIESARHQTELAMERLSNQRSRDFFKRRGR